MSRDVNPVVLGIRLSCWKNLNLPEGGVVVPYRPQKPCHMIFEPEFHTSSSLVGPSSSGPFTWPVAVRFLRRCCSGWFWVCGSLGWFLFLAPAAGDSGLGKLLAGCKVFFQDVVFPCTQVHLVWIFMSRWAITIECPRNYR